MAIFEQRGIKQCVLDDTEPITCIIENWQNINGHTEFIIKVHRGPFSNQTWKIHKRYNDFVKLHQSLQMSKIPIELPPKKLIGNMDPQFIIQRQQALQKYLNSILMNPILASSLPTRSFIDPANYCQPFGEIALQHVSMALRGEVGWDVVEPLTDIGWRARKHFFTLKCKSHPKEELIGEWTDYGPDKYLNDKDMHSVFKSLNQIQHPFIEHIDLCLCTDVGGLVARNFNKNGSLRDLLCGSKPKLSFLKKYGNPKGHKILTSDEIALYGRQILEALKFLHEKGYPYGHLHSGNILIEENRIKLLNIENGILGVPSFYRPYFMQHKKINTLQAIDVYCFGHVLYEMVIGTPLHESIISENMCDCPSQIRNILELILSHDACKNGLPTIETLLSMPFFANVQLNLLQKDKAHFRISTTVKEHLKSVVTKIEDRLISEQKVVRSQKRLTKVQEMMSCEEERKKHRHKMKHEKSLSREQKSKDDNMKKSLDMDRCDSINSSATASVGTSTPPSTFNTVPSSPPPLAPPPPPPAPPQQQLLLSSTILPTTSTTAAAAAADLNQSNSNDNDRSALLNAINSFNKSALKKVQNVSR